MMPPPICGTATSAASAASSPSAFILPRGSAHLRRYAVNTGPIRIFVKRSSTTFTNSNGCSMMYRAAIAVPRVRATPNGLACEASAALPSAAMSAVDDPVALPTAADVDEAARRLSGIALHTPLLTSVVLDAMTGGRIFLKAETLQRTGSFKFRGAYNKLAAIPPERRAGGVVAYSSGNHAQGVAAAAQLLGMPCVIVMPRDAPRAKRERTAAFGAEIVLYDRVRDDRETIAAELAARRGAILV